MMVRRKTQGIVVAALVLLGLMVALMAILTHQTATEVSPTSPVFASVIGTPITTPFWIYELQPAPGNNISPGGLLCVHINTDWLWEPNDRTTSMPHKIGANFNLTIDQQPFLLKDSIEHTFVFIAEGYGVYDDQNRLIGEGWGDATTCWELNLPYGSHHAIASFKTSLGSAYSYSWSFNVVPYVSITSSPIYTAPPNMEVWRNSGNTTATALRGYFVATFGAERKTMEAGDPDWAKYFSTQ